MRLAAEYTSGNIDCIQSYSEMRGHPRDTYFRQLNDSLRTNTIYARCLVCNSNVRHVMTGVTGGLHLDLQRGIAYIVCSQHCEEVYNLNPLPYTPEHEHTYEVLIGEQEHCPSTWGPYKCKKIKGHDGHCGDGGGWWKRKGA